MLDSVRIPLKVWNAAQLAGVAAAVTAGAWLTFALSATPDVAAETRRVERALSQAYAEAVAQDLGQIEADARTLGLLVQAAGAGAATEGPALMRAFLRLKPAYREATLAAPDGTVTIASDPRRYTASLSQPIGLLRSRRVQVAVVTGSGDRDGGGPFDLVVSLGVPGQSDSLALGIGPAFFTAIAERVRGSRPGAAEGATFSVRSADGRLLSGLSPREGEGAHREGEGTHREGEGTASPTLASPSLANPGWTITARLAPGALTPPPRPHAPALVLGLVVVLGAGGLGYALAHRTARLLAQLAAPLPPTDIPVVSRIRECDDLAQALYARARSAACLLAGTEAGLDRIQGRLTSFEAMSGWRCWEVDPATRRVVWADQAGLPVRGADLAADMAALRERIEPADRPHLDGALAAAARADGLHEVVLRVRAVPPEPAHRLLVRVLRRPAGAGGGWRLHVLSRALLRRDADGGQQPGGDRRRNHVLRRVTNGIVHDFNDILTVILASLGTLKRRHPLGEDQARLVDTALAGALRGRALTRSMLGFVRNADDIAVECDLATVMASFVPFLQANVLDNMPVIDRVPAQLPKLTCSERVVEIALLNIALHFRDLGLRGLAIAANARDSEGDASLDLVPGSYLRLLIASGRPVPGAVLRTGREPTTLAMVAPLVSQLRGGWRIHDDGSGAASFLAELWLPARPRRAAVAAAPGTGSGPLRVLLVESDSLVRASVAEALLELGHGVIQAASADHALRILDEEAAIDVMIVDQSLPVMSGLQLAATVVRQHPRIRIVLASPQGQLPAAARAFLHLEKPFRPEDLAEILDRADIRAAA
ncbi:response regulator [Methylobacterium sp. ID0610]|uniref:response regulator n=1 Tax=Methylobacterium carpenticola TaxID=3344827 RepID=UPI00369DBDFD